MRGCQHHALIIVGTAKERIEFQDIPWLRRACTKAGAEDVPPEIARKLVAAGLVSGVAGTATSVGGPPVALLYQRAEGKVLRSTMGVYFLGGNVVSVAVLAVAGEVGGREVLRALVLVPFVVAGFLLSGPLRRRVEGPGLRLAVLLLSAGSAVVLLVRTLL